MPRLNVVDPNAAGGKVRELFAGPLKNKRLNIFKGMANSPAALEAYLALAENLKAGELSPAEREVIALVLAESNNCDYCLAAHSTVAKAAGMTDGQILAARRGQLDDPKLDALARFVTALHEKRGWVGDEELDALRSAGYGDGQVVEIIAGYAQNILTNYFNHVNQTEVDFPPAPGLR